MVAAVAWAERKDRIVTIYLDNIVFDLQEMGGISVYFAELITRLLSEGHDVRFVERSTMRSNGVRRALPISGDMIEVERGFRPLARYRPIRLALNEPSIVHSSYYRTCYDRNAVNVVTVYDFTYERFGRGVSRYVHSRGKRRSLENADGIICISRSTRADLLKLHRNIDPARVGVIHLGASPAYAPLGMADAAASARGLGDRGHGTDDVLYIGSRFWYKNFMVAVEAVSRVAATRLVIVGGGELTPDERRALEAKLAGRYVFHRRVTTPELNGLYNGALCLLYPSNYEGFGLPVLEAMQAGCPVIAANRSSIPEVAGQACVLLDTIDADVIAEKIAVLRDPRARSGLIKAGIERAGAFSWERTFRETLQFYERTMSARSAR